MSYRTPTRFGTVPGHRVIRFVWPYLLVLIGMDERIATVESLALLLSNVAGAVVEGRKKHRCLKPQLSSLCRPSAIFPQASWSPAGDQCYVIGNTHGFNVAAGLPESIVHARILLAGCGDVRNLLATVAGCMRAVVIVAAISLMLQQTVAATATRCAD